MIVKRTMLLAALLGVSPVWAQDALKVTYADTDPAAMTATAVLENGLSAHIDLASGETVINTPSGQTFVVPATSLTLQQQAVLADLYTRVALDPSGMEFSGVPITGPSTPTVPRWGYPFNKRSIVGIYAKSSWPGGPLNPPCGVYELCRPWTSPSWTDTGFRYRWTPYDAVPESHWSHFYSPELIAYDETMFNAWRSGRCQTYDNSMLLSGGALITTVTGCLTAETGAGAIVCGGGIVGFIGSARESSSAHRDCNRSYGGPGSWTP